MHPSDHRSVTLRFRELNLAGGLLLPNAWDAASARVFEQAGFPAVGTTSSGVAFSRGLRDGQAISRADMMREIATIAAAVDCPVTADVEGGYGPSLADVEETVNAALDAGATGINLEDVAHDAIGSTGPDGAKGPHGPNGSDRPHGVSGANEPHGAPVPDSPGATPLLSIANQAARLAAARAAADRRNIPLVINARTDMFLKNLGASEEERVAETVARGRAYVEAGADLVFIPLLLDPALVRLIATAIGAPISLMAVPGAPPAADLFAAGAARVSLGPLVMLAALGLVRQIADDIRATGTWASMVPTFYGFAEADALFTRAPVAAPR